MKEEGIKKEMHKNETSGLAAKIYKSNRSLLMSHELKKKSQRKLENIVTETQHINILVCAQSIRGKFIALNAYVRRVSDQ